MDGADRISVEILKPTEENLKLILDLHYRVFFPDKPGKEIDDESLMKFKTRLTGAPFCLCLIAKYDGLPAGYKVGYQERGTYFYSWMGGVLPEFRKTGIAKTLMKKQHEIIRAEGYKYVRTETLADNNPMLILNLKSGFKIMGTRYRGNRPPGPVKILLEKKL